MGCRLRLVVETWKVTGSVLRWVCHDPHQITAEFMVLKQVQRCRCHGRCLGRSSPYSSRTNRIGWRDRCARGSRSAETADTKSRPSGQTRRHARRKSDPHQSLAQMGACRNTRYPVTICAAQSPCWIRRLHACSMISAVAMLARGRRVSRLVAKCSVQSSAGFSTAMAAI